MRGDRPSDTAVLIGRCMLLAARDPVRRPLVPRHAEAALGALLSDRGAWFDRALRHGWGRAMFLGIERAILPGIVTHYLVRKQWLETAVRAALERGVTQVVALGAGFDTLAWRLHRELPAVAFFELDHPATQAPKRERLPPGANLAYLPVDLDRESPAAALAACPRFAATRPTLFIAEGLLMYFSEDAVAALLRRLAAATRPSATFLFSFMARAPDGTISFRNGSPLIDWWLRSRREPFRWGHATAALPDFLKTCGLRLVAIADHDALRAQVLRPLGLDRLTLARGECLCHCTSA